MEKCGDGEVPSSVSGHDKTEERPNTVIVERWYEDGRGTTSTKYIRPSPLVQSIVYVIYIAATHQDMT